MWDQNIATVASLPPKNLRLNSYILLLKTCGICACQIPNFQLHFIAIWRRFLSERLHFLACNFHSVLLIIAKHPKLAWETGVKIPTKMLKNEYLWPACCSKLNIYIKCLRNRLFSLSLSFLWISKEFPQWVKLNQFKRGKMQIWTLQKSPTNHQPPLNTEHSRFKIFCLLKSQFLFCGAVRSLFAQNFKCYGEIQPLMRGKKEHVVLFRIDHVALFTF